MMHTLTAKEYREIVAPKKRSKYGNKPTYLVGNVLTTDKAEAAALAKATGVKVVRFASYAEAKRDSDLHRLQLADKIHALTRQPIFDLFVNGKKICRYIGDWSYRDGPMREHNSPVVVEDRKGALTKDFKIKWALAKALHPEIEWRLS